MGERLKARMKETGARLKEQNEAVLDWVHQHPLHTLAAVVFALGIFYFFWIRPVGQLENLRATHPDRLYEIKTATRVGLIQALGAIFLILGVYLAWRRLEVAQEGQITERFTRAIDQLGSEKLEIRLGGIYALERIARDSKKDHWPIMEVLTAYVRENARWKGQELSSIEKEQEKIEQREEDQQEPKPPLDIQAILTVLRRRETNHEKGEQRFDLQRTDLRGASLESAHLEGALLTKANLEAAILCEAHLEKAWLVGAHLQWTYLEGAHLERARLDDACLTRGWPSRNSFRRD